MLRSFNGDLFSMLLPVSGGMVRENLKKLWLDFFCLPFHFRLIERRPKFFLPKLLLGRCFRLYSG